MDGQHPKQKINYKKNKRALSMRKGSEDGDKFSYRIENELW
jgi:hypothetical protein